MRKNDLHRSLQATAVAVPGKGGCYAVVPNPVASSVDVPACAAAFQMARRELDLLKGQLSRCTYADRLLRSLNRREAVDSSQIEGTRTSFDELLLYEMDLADEGVPRDADASETLAYVDAATHGEAAARINGQSALNRQLLLDLHARLMAGNPRALPGHFRTVQNHIGGPRIEDAVFIPPPPREVERLMTDLEGLLQYAPEDNRVSSILMRAAIAHAQFEAIHPFADGNGRIGRMLLPLMLQAEGEPPIHLATFLKRRQGEYYEKLRAAQMRLDWTPWVGLFLDSVIASCRHTGQLVVEIDDIQIGWNEQLKARRKRRHATIWRVAELLPGQPVITAKEAARQLQVTFPAANDALAELVDLDILRPSNARRRNRAFQAHQVLNALHTGLDEVLR
jgi:Fic family protein